MGIFNKIFSSEPKSYDKQGDMLKKIMTTKEQRLEAIDSLEKLPPEKSIPQLLKRFEIVIDSGLLDNREKEMCLKIIVSHGEKAKDHIIKSLASQKRIAWHIKMAEKIFSKSEYVSLLLQNLNGDMEVFDEDALDRNAEILLALREIPDTQIVQAAQKFLSCRDEQVRMAAVECLEEQAHDSLEAKQAIINLVKIPLTDDNSRFIGVANEIAKKHNWL